MHGLKFQEIIKEEFRAYKSKNPRCSLRSFAKYLGLATTTLYQYLNGIHEPSKKNLLRISERLRWRQEVVDELLTQIQVKKRDRVYGPDLIDLNKCVMHGQPPKNHFVMSAKIDSEQLMTIAREFADFLRGLERKYPVDSNSDIYTSIFCIIA